MKKSVGINAVINGLKTIISLLFPLITYPYITRILEVDALGSYNYSYSIISYFYLFSALGTSTYAIREGAKYRDTREEISKFSSEVYTINLISTVVSYIVCFIMLIIFTGLHPYASIIMVLSISMIFTTLGCEWIFSIYEEYLYISIRSIIFQIISLVMLFVFVKTKDDVIWYAITIVVSSSGSNIVNLISKRKYCDWHLSFNKDIKKHIKPIIILFANSLATTIYVSADITVLGMLTSDYHVGIYTISSKIYSILKQVLSAIIIVSIPRLSWMLGQNDKEGFSNLATRILNMLICFVLPAATGICFLGKNAILLISTEKFLPAITSLRILCLALIICLFNWFYTSCILIPSKKEKKVLLATVCSALLNLILNFILIPFFKATPHI